MEGVFVGVKGVCICEGWVLGKNKGAKEKDELPLARLLFDSSGSGWLKRVPTGLACARNNDKDSFKFIAPIS